MALYYPTEKNAVQKTLDASLDAGVTTVMTLNSVTGIQNKAGVCVIDRVDSNGTATASKREYVAFTGVSGSTLTGLTRNADSGGSDQDHGVGAIVEFVSDVLQQQAILDGLLNVVTTAGALDTTKVVDLTTAQTLTNKTLTSPVFQGTVDGWISADETWAYASATTITVPSGAEAKYAKGDKIKLTQTTVKYFYVVGVADTVLTVAGGSGYTVASDTITDNYYSHASSPIGFPVGFNLTTPTWTSSGTAFANQPSCTALFTIIGNMCNVRINGQAHATSSATGLFYVNFTAGEMPSTSKDTSIGMAFCISTGIGGFTRTAAGQATRITVSKYDGTALFTNSQYYGASVSWLF